MKALNVGLLGLSSLVLLSASECSETSRLQSTTATDGSIPVVTTQELEPATTFEPRGKRVAKLKSKLGVKEATRLIFDQSINCWNPSVLPEAGLDTIQTVGERPLEGEVTVYQLSGGTTYGADSEVLTVHVTPRNGGSQLAVYRINKQLKVPNHLMKDIHRWSKGKPGC
ncbi:hypothetical protein N9K16_00370 [Alphaproteobacteria bacterium]|nr:hypothetical protein [Alphaproteobacteria bacterium]